MLECPEPKKNCFKLALELFLHIVQAEGKILNYASDIN